jgi:hypothetical protein
LALNTKRAAIFPMIASRRAPFVVQIETKDILVSIPLVGSAMAVTWEIGSFVPIGWGPFGLFTLSEHLLFAMQALPIGLLIAAVIPVLVMGVRNIGRPRPSVRFSSLMSRSTKLRVGIAVGTVLFFILAGVLAYMAVDARSIVLMVMASGVATLGLVFGLYPPALVLWPKLLFVTVFAFALAFSMALGCDMMRGTLSYVDRAARDADLIHIIIDGVGKDVELLRSGERGLLVYEHASRKFSFVKWDTVKGLEWARRPLVKISRPSTTP